MKRSVAPFRRLWLLILLVLVLAGGWWWFSVRQPDSDTIKDSLADKAVSMAKEHGVTSFDGKKVSSNGNPLEDAVGLALQGINLFQGEKGLELWRLKASWAHLSKDGDEINVDDPHVVYAMGDTGLPTRAAAGSEEPDQAATQPEQKQQNEPNGQNTQNGQNEQAAKAADFPDFGDADVLDVTAKKGRVTDHQRHLTLWDNVVITRFGDTLTGPRMNYDSAKRTMTFPEGAQLESERGSGTATVLHWDLANNVISGENGVSVLLKPRTQTEEEAATPAAQETAPQQGQTSPAGKTASTLAPSSVSASGPGSDQAAVNSAPLKKDGKATPSAQKKKSNVKNGQKTQKKSQSASSRTANASKRDKKPQGPGAASGTPSTGKP